MLFMDVVNTDLFSQSGLNKTTVNVKKCLIIQLPKAQNEFTVL